MPETASDIGAQVLRRIADVVMMTEFGVVMDEAPITMGLKLGCTGLETGDTPETLLARAHSALSDGARCRSGRGFADARGGSADRAIRASDREAGGRSPAAARRDLSHSPGLGASLIPGRRGRGASRL